MTAPAPLETLEVLTGENPQHAVIWLHGLGADYHDFESLVPEIITDDFPPIRFIFPNAPVRPITLNGGMPMRGWYDIKGLDMDQRQDSDGIRESQAGIEALISQEKDRGVPASKIILAGFSQGGAVVLHTGIRHPETLGGIIALSTYLPLGDTLDAEKTEAALKTPIFQAHGTYDPIVAYQLGEMTRDLLQSLGVQVTYKTYPMEHSLHYEEIDAIKSWLGNIFK